MMDEMAHWEGEEGGGADWDSGRVDLVKQMVLNQLVVVRKCIHIASSPESETSQSLFRWGILPEVVSDCHNTNKLIPTVKSHQSFWYLSLFVLGTDHKYAKSFESIIVHVGERIWWHSLYSNEIGEGFEQFSNVRRKWGKENKLNKISSVEASQCQVTFLAAGESGGVYSLSTRLFFWLFFSLPPPPPTFSNFQRIFLLSLSNLFSDSLLSLIPSLG